MLPARARRRGTGPPDFSPSTRPPPHFGVVEVGILLVPDRRGRTRHCCTSGGGSRGVDHETLFIGADLDGVGLQLTGGEHGGPRPVVLALRQRYSARV